MDKHITARYNKDKNGIIRFWTKIFNGKKHGETKVFRADGTCKESYIYENGKKCTMELFDEKEQLKYFCKYDLYGKKEHVKRFNNNHELTTDMKYKDGYQSEGFEHVGNIRVELRKSGNKTHVSKHHLGVIITHSEYETESKDPYEVDMINTTIKYTETINNKTIIKHMKNGKLHGHYQHYQNQILVIDGNYVEDMRQGMHLLISNDSVNEYYYMNDKMYLMIVKKNDIIIRRYEMNGDILCGLQQKFDNNGSIKKRWVVTPEGQEINIQEFD